MLHCSTHSCLPQCSVHVAQLRGKDGEMGSDQNKKSKMGMGLFKYR